MTANDSTDGAPLDERATDGGEAVETDADRPTDGAGGPDDAAEPVTTGGDRAVGADGNEAVREYLLKGALVVLAVLGVVATLQFYLSAMGAITQLTAPEFRPLFRAAFNLVVLLAVGIGVAQVVRRLG